MPVSELKEFMDDYQHKGKVVTGGDSNTSVMTLFPIPIFSAGILNYKNVLVQTIEIPLDFYPQAALEHTVKKAQKYYNWSKKSPDWQKRQYYIKLGTKLNLK